MKRRRLLQSVAVIPALPALPAAAQYTGGAPSESQMPKLAETSPDGVGVGVRKFFTTEQLNALRKLGEIIAPKSGDRPGAVEANAAEFLDFLVGESELPRKLRYQRGLDHLNAESRRKHVKPFAELTAAEAEPLLAPLKEAWRYHAPADSVAYFLREAKDDLLQATMNSRPFADAMSRRSRAAAGMGAYWLPLD